MPPWHSGYIIWGSILGYYRARWAFQSIKRCLRGLINIRPGYLIFRQGNTCTIESYLPSHFARQFRYDQIYGGNLNTGLHFNGNIFEGVRAWYFQVARETGVMFSLPQRSPNEYISLSFCTWYVIADMVLGYEMNASCIKAFKTTYSAYRGSKTILKKRMN